MARIRLAGEVFEGLNKPKRTPGDSKKFAVAVLGKSGDPVIVRFGDPSMQSYGIDAIMMMQDQQAREKVQP